MSVQERDPCPHRILDDIGGAFSMGAIGGGVWHVVKGARNSPRGERLIGSVTAVRARVPVIGGTRTQPHAAQTASIAHAKNTDLILLPRGMDGTPDSRAQCHRPTRRQFCRLGRALFDV